MRGDPDEGGSGEANTGAASTLQQEGSSAARSLQREASAGSYSSDDPDRPQWTSDTSLVQAFDYAHADGRYAYTVLKGRRPDGDKAFLTGRRLSGDDLMNARADCPQELYRYPGLDCYMKGSGDEPDLLYRLPELSSEMAARPDDPVFICEGEKDTDTLRSHGFISTTNPNGAGKFRSTFAKYFADRDVVIPPDNDARGRQHAAKVFGIISGVARSVKIVNLPGLPEKGDATAWFDAGNTKDDLIALTNRTGVARSGAAASQHDSKAEGVGLDDFHAFMPSHNYIFAPSGEPWPAASVNSRIPPVELTDRNGQPELNADGEPVRIPANRWLDQNRPVEQMVWAPGKPQIVRDSLVSEGGWIQRPGCNVFNQYRPPAPIKGDPAQAGPWIDHVHRVYPGDAEHTINWLAHQVQRPDDKTNHALVLGGPQGIGKDTLLEPVKAAVGPWNFAEVSPKHMLGRFNGFVRSVILRVSEARDLGDIDRFAFYDHMKTYTAAPPDVLRVDEKFMREYSAFNVCGVIITSNHKTNGLYIPEDDRRHYVAWSDLTKEDFSDEYWQRLWDWYHAGGIGHVAAYLASRDLTSFRAKAPPPKTEAFWDIVASNSAPEDDELSDALAKLNSPDVVTLSAIADAAESSFADWLRDRKNARRVPHKMEECGYRSVRNPNSKRGRWKVDQRDVMIYARKELSIREAIIAAEKLASEGVNVPF